MIFNNTLTIPFAQFENLLSYQDTILHFLTTRNSSLPPSVKNNFTIGLNGIVDNATVLRNRRLIANQFGFSSDAFVLASQVHGNRVAIVREEDRGRGAFDRSSYLPDVDAMVTDKPGISLIAQAADCVPILYFDPVRLVIGAAHAGWKGTISRISARVVNVLAAEFGSNPSDLVVGIGPSIGPCCYEVGEEVVGMVKRNFRISDGLIISSNKYSKPVFDLWEANRRILIEEGVAPFRIEQAELCTKCNNNFFFSARSGDKGRFGAVIMLRPD